MSNCEIFDLLYSGVIDADNRVFTHKYVFGKQRSRIHLLKTDEEINPVKILDFLNKLQEKYACNSGWNPFHISSSSLKYQSVTIFDFLSQTEEELRIYQHFCDLAISWLVLFT